MIVMSLNRSVQSLRFLNIITTINHLIIRIKMFFRTNSYIETFEDRGKISYDLFLSLVLIKTLPTAFFTRRILQRQNAVEDLSSFTTTITYNNIF